MTTPLIKSGDWGDITAQFTVRARKKNPALKRMTTLRAISNATRSEQPCAIDFPKSKETRGLGLKSLKLTDGFEGFLQGIFNKVNEIYFISWAWDLSGRSPFLYPSKPATRNTPIAPPIIPMKVGRTRKFLGSGINLFPARQIVGGLGVRIMIWENDSGVRESGRALQQVAEEIQKSKLNQLLPFVAAVGGASTLTVEAVYQASLELARIVGMVLKNNSDDYVDYYEGYYPVEKPWTAGRERHVGNSTEIVLERIKG